MTKKMKTEKRRSLIKSRSKQIKSNKFQINTSMSGENDQWGWSISLIELFIDGSYLSIYLSIELSHTHTHSLSLTHNNFSFFLCLCVCVSLCLSMYMYIYCWHISLKMTDKELYSIFFIIIIIISCWQHGYPWPSLATPPYRSST